MYKVVFERFWPDGPRHAMTSRAGQSPMPNKERERSPPAIPRPPRRRRAPPLRHSPSPWACPSSTTSPPAPRRPSSSKNSHRLRPPARHPRPGVDNADNAAGAMPVAVGDLSAWGQLQVLSRFIGRPVEPLLAPPADVAAAINAAYQQRTGRARPSSKSSTPATSFRTWSARPPARRRPARTTCSTLPAAPRSSSSSTWSCSRRCRRGRRTSTSSPTRTHWSSASASTACCTTPSACPRGSRRRSSAGSR